MPPEVQELNQLFLLLVQVRITHTGLPRVMIQPKKKRLAAPKPCDSDPTNLTVRGPTPEVFCKKRWITRELKVLLSKVSYEEQGLDQDEIILMQELFLRLTFYAEKDWNYMIWLAPLLAVQNLVYKIQPNQSRKNGLKMEFLAIGEAGRDMILSPHEYFGLKNQEFREGKARLIWKYPRKVKPPIERYIGVGYKDKGNCRDLSWDGSPTMREYCRSETFRTQLEEDNRRSRPKYGDIPFGHPTIVNGTYTDQKDPCLHHVRGPNNRFHTIWVL